MSYTTADLARQSVPEIRERDARARRTMKLLHGALIELIEEHSFDSITIDNVVEKAGVGRSTFYRHYATKEALFHEIAVADIEHLVDHSYPLFNSSDTRPSSTALVKYVDHHRKLWTALLTGGAASVMRETFHKLAVERARRMVSDADLEIPFELGAAWGVSSTVEVLSWWLRQPEPIPLEQIVEYMERLTSRPVLDRHKPAKAGPPKKSMTR